MFVDYYGQTQTANDIVNSVAMNKLKFDKIKGKSNWLSGFIPGNKEAA